MDFSRFAKDCTVRCGADWRNNCEGTSPNRTCHTWKQCPDEWFTQHWAATFQPEGFFFDSTLPSSYFDLKTVSVTPNKINADVTIRIDHERSTISPVNQELRLKVKVINVDDDDAEDPGSTPDSSSSDDVSSPGTDQGPIVDSVTPDVGGGGGPFSGSRDDGSGSGAGYDGEPGVGGGCVVSAGASSGNLLSLLPLGLMVVFCLFLRSGRLGTE